MLMKLEEIREKLQQCNLREVAERTGLHYMTVYNISSGTNENPKYKVLLKLSEFCEVLK